MAFKRGELKELIMLSLQSGEPDEDGLIKKTAKDVFKDVREGDIASMSGALANFWRGGDLVREPDPAHAGKRGVSYRYWINPDPKPLQVERKLKKATEAGLVATIEELKAKIRELTDWQEAAIKRYPDLAVPPTVIKARKIVADRLRASGDTSGAKEVLAGNRDSTMLVQAVVDALDLVA